MKAPARILLSLMVACSACKGVDKHAAKKAAFYQENAGRLASLVSAVAKIKADANSRAPLTAQDGSPVPLLSFESTTKPTTNARFVSQETLNGEAFKTIVAMQDNHWLKAVLKYGPEANSKKVTSFSALKFGLQLKYVLVIRESAAASAEIIKGVGADTFAAGRLAGDVLLYELPEGAYLGGYPFVAVNSDNVRTMKDDPEGGLSSNLSLQGQRAILANVGKLATKVELAQLEKNRARPAEGK